MKWFWITSLLLLGLLFSAVRAGDAPVTYHVQLVRGTDAATPPAPDCTPVGVPLAHHLQSVLKWKNYWLVGSRQITVASGKKEHVHFSGNREVVIDLSQPAKRTVAALDNGRVVGRAICPRGPEMTLIGRDRDSASAWFVVVRREQPTTATARR